MNSKSWNFSIETLACLGMLVAGWGSEGAGTGSSTVLLEPEGTIARGMEPGVEVDGKGQAPW